MRKNLPIANPKRASKKKEDNLDMLEDLLKFQRNLPYILINAQQKIPKDNYASRSGNDN